MRTKPLEGGPDQAIWADGFAVRKRQGWRLHHRLRARERRRHRTEVLPLRAVDFSGLRAEWRSLQFRLGGRFFDEARIPERWTSTRQALSEPNRVLDPEPSRSSPTPRWPNSPRLSRYSQWRRSRNAGRVHRRHPGCRSGDLRDRCIPGFLIATGFSGHGFGIGPAAGRLMADIVTDRAPIVDPRPSAFRGSATDRRSS